MTNDKELDEILTRLRNAEEWQRPGDEPIGEAKAKLEALITKAKLDEVTAIRKQFHSHRFGISEFMNNRIKELEGGDE